MNIGENSQIQDIQRMLLMIRPLIGQSFRAKPKPCLVECRKIVQNAFCEMLHKNYSWPCFNMLITTELARRSALYFFRTNNQDIALRETTTPLHYVYGALKAVCSGAVAGSGSGVWTSLAGSGFAGMSAGNSTTGSGSGGNGSGLP